MSELAKANHQICTKCGRQTFACMRCRKRFHAADGPPRKATAGPDDASGIDTDYAICEPCFRLVSKYAGTM
jgi:hypothetical protein